MNNETTSHLDATTNSHEFGPGVFFSYVPVDVSGAALHEWSPELIYLAGRTAQDFNHGAQPLTPFDFDGVPAYGGITDTGRAFLLIEVTEASWSACPPVTTVH